MPGSGATNRLTGAVVACLALLIPAAVAAQPVPTDYLCGSDGTPDPVHHVCICPKAKVSATDDAGAARCVARRAPRAVQRDDCPGQPEDEDGFEDNDGCPDPDNDADRIVDVRDGCPDEAEDVDGHQDADGCPDPDDDGDGILDRGDRCAGVPEDRDGFEDADGCPDTDNDADGIVDGSDRCPDEAEDRDGVDDSDGCADTAPLADVQAPELGERIRRQAPGIGRRRQLSLAFGGGAVLSLGGAVALRMWADRLYQPNKLSFATDEEARAYADGNRAYHLAQAALGVGVGLALASGYLWLSGGRQDAAPVVAVGSRHLSISIAGRL